MVKLFNLKIVLNKAIDCFQFYRNYGYIKKNKVKKANYYVVSKKGDLKETAKNLYATLRKIKKDNFKSIAVCKIPKKGFGKIINDRLTRASKF